CLDKRMSAPCFPGNTINLLAAKKPIVAITDKLSETARIIDDAECGVIIEPTDVTELKDTIMKFSLTPSIGERYGKNGRDFFMKNMMLDCSVQSYEKIVRKIIGDSN
ncbi:MAG: hypothetical protein ABFD07_03595, partial [Methanobacterium sp.]